MTHRLDEFDACRVHVRTWTACRKRAATRVPRPRRQHHTYAVLGSRSDRLRHVRSTARASRRRAPPRLRRRLAVCTVARSCCHETPIRPTPCCSRCSSPSSAPTDRPPGEHCQQRTSSDPVSGRRWRSWRARRGGRRSVPSATREREQALVVQVDVVLPGEADATEDLDRGAAELRRTRRSRTRSASVAARCASPGGRRRAAQHA